jgi:hypothetical protein
MADTLHELLDPSNPSEELPYLKNKDIGFANYGERV